MPELDPIISEFASTEEAYDAWFRATVQASLNDTRPGIPHEEVMAEMDALMAGAGDSVEVLDILRARRKYP